jgi:hypothetical protein
MALDICDDPEVTAGHTSSRVEEFAPTPEQIRAAPQLAEDLGRPMMLLVSARGLSPK